MLVDEFCVLDQISILFTEVSSLRLPLTLVSPIFVSFSLVPYMNVKWLITLDCHN